jgi:hypothetical protein
MFIHEFVERYELDEKIENDIRYYTNPSVIGSEWFPSVTSIIGASDYFDRSWLAEWQRLVGQDRAEKIKIQAGNRGTALHKICEKYILNDVDYKKGAMPTAIADFNRIKSKIDENVDIVYGIELPLYSTILRTGGRSDLIAQWKKKKAIIDFKTKRFKEKKTPIKEDIIGYFVQASAYARMYNDLYSSDIEDIVILMSVDHSEPLVFEEKVDKYKEIVDEVFIKRRNEGIDSI